MGIKTGISWASHTASPWHGCAHATYTDADGNEHAHQGCLNCYAEAMAPRNPGVLGVWGKNGTRVMSASFHDNCRRWNKAAEKSGKRASVFPSICDPFESWDGPIHDNRGLIGHVFNSDGSIGFGPDTKAFNAACTNARALTLADLRRDLFTTIDACPMLDFLLLTKRPQNVREMWPEKRFDGAGWNGTLTGYWYDRERKYYRPNVRLLTSISTQADADALIPHLIDCRDLVPVLGVSAEPLLGEIDLELIHGALREGSEMCHYGQQHELRRCDCAFGLDWLIIGNESKRKGVGRLPGGTEEGYWRAANSLVEQCRAADVPVFFKQGPINGRTSHDPVEWPEWARVQEYPFAESLQPYSTERMK